MISMSEATTSRYLDLSNKRFGDSPCELNLWYTKNSCRLFVPAQGLLLRPALVDSGQGWCDISSATDPE